MFEVRKITDQIEAAQKETPTSHVGASNNKDMGTAEASMITQNIPASMTRIKRDANLQLGAMEYAELFASADRETKNILTAIRFNEESA